MQPLKDLLKPIQDAASKMTELATGGNALKEALKPCLAALAATQRKVDEDAKRIVAKSGEQIDLLKASLLSAWEVDVKKITDYVEFRVMTKLNAMTSTQSERFGRVEATQAELPSLLKSHTGLITNFRSALAEYSEDHQNTQKNLRDLSEEIGRMGERIAENTEALQAVREAMHGLADTLAGVKEAVMRSSPPYRSPRQALLRVLQRQTEASPSAWTRPSKRRQQ